MSVLLPLVGVSVVLLTVFELFVRPLVPVGAILPSLIGIVTCGLLVGIVNAVRYVRKAYKR